jgi:ABC-type lipoprotein release transport system permease subunit
MNLAFKLSWRNVLRNRRRSLIAGVAIGVGLAALIVTDAITFGMQAAMLQSATGSFMGEAQIHGEGFRETLGVEKTIQEPRNLLSRLESDSLVSRYAPRVMTLGMASSSANVSTVTLVGVDPAREVNLSEMDDALVEGQYLDPQAPRDLLIGSGLADLLEVSLGDRVVLTAAQAHTGDLSQELFRVSGIFHLNVTELDRMIVYVNLTTAQAMLALDEDIHEVAVGFHNIDDAGRTDAPFWTRFEQDGNEAVGWRTILPGLSAAFELVEVQMIIIGLILFGIVSLGIINTLFMSLYERMFEFGVLRAVGTRPGAMARLVILEAGWLGAIGAGFGVLLAALTIWILSYTGIDYSGVEFAGATMRELLYPVSHTSQYTLYPIIVFTLTAVVGLYPALYAARLTPAEAMRRAL